MKSKLWFLTKVSLSRKVKTKAFVIVNILLAIGLVALFNIDSIIKTFGGDFDEPYKVYIMDNTNNSYDIINTNIIETSKSVYGDDDKTFEISKYEKTKEEAHKELEKNGKAILLEIDNDPTKVIKVTLTTEGYLDTLPYQILYQAISSSKTSIAMINSNIDPEELNKILSNVEIERIILDETKTTDDENMEAIMSTVFPIFILPFFMLTIFLIQMIGMEVNDEKTTRGMEIIISNVSPRTHFFSKLLAGNIFVIGQSLLLLVYAGVGLLVRTLIGSGSIIDGLSGELGNVFNSLSSSGIIDKLGYVIPLTVVLMLLSFISYSLLAGILASITTNAEDFSQMQTPMMLMLLVGYYFSIMAGMFKGSIFIQVLSYVPFISAILSPSLLVIGQIGIVDVIIAIVVNIGAIYLLIKYGLRIYKVGILNYSSKDLWKKMFKAMKN